jgi:phage-related protein
LKTRPEVDFGFVDREPYCNVAKNRLIAFLGDALDLLRAFPEGARKEAGVQLHKIQQGLTPTD